MSGESRRLRWPAERFYWAVCEAPGVRRGGGAGVVPEGLLSLIEEEVPSSAWGAGKLHAVGVPAADGRLVVCACPHETLEGVGPEALSLAPEAIPACVGESVDPARLNLLAGAFEPAPVRRVRTRRHLLASAAVLGCSLLLALGLLRRAGAWRRSAAEATAARAVLLMEVAPPGTPESLRRELALAQAKAQAAGVEPPPDAALAVASLLAAWPAGVPSRPQSIAVRGPAASIAVVVEGDPAPFLRALRPPAGWRLLEPRLNGAGSGSVRLSLELRKESTP